ncbi:type II toxin-antitoxin system RelE/ParE family toxin [Promicromonospora xylanilytica]
MSETLAPELIKDILKGGAALAWEILITDAVEVFLDQLRESDRETHRLVNSAIQVLEDNGPMEGRPLVDSIAGSKISNLKELRPPSAGRTEIRMLFCFDPWRSAILLVAGDKAGRWNRWYQDAIPTAEQFYAVYLSEREEEAAHGRR